MGERQIDLEPSTGCPTPACGCVRSRVTHPNNKNRINETGNQKYSTPSFFNKGERSSDVRTKCMQDA